jgi:hypothetical protein
MENKNYENGERQVKADIKICDYFKQGNLIQRKWSTCTKIWKNCFG